MNNLSIRRGTTPVITFSIPVSAEEVTQAEAVFYLGINAVIKKTAADCEIDGKTLTVMLTQQETLRLTRGASGHVSVSVQTKDMNLRSQRVMFTVKDCLKDEVI